jgi:TrmH family RNA methyltransferase
MYTSQDDFDDVYLQKDIGAWSGFEKNQLCTPNSCLAVFKIPTEKKVKEQVLFSL